MRGDDAVGPLLAKKLTEIFRENSQITVLNAENCPRKLHRTHQKRESVPFNIIRCC